MNIALSHVWKSFGGQAVLSDFSLALPAQGVVALCGPSGCGKTTLLRLIAGLEKPDGGTVSAPDGLRISMAFQEDRLLPWFTALQNIAVAAPKADAAHWLERVGLGRAMQKLPEELSGGMRRRVAIARALAYGGELFLLDEPFKALDDAARGAMIACVMRAIRGRLAVLVTHELTEAASMADTVLLLDGPPLRVVSEVSFPVSYADRGLKQVGEYRLQLERARTP